jgi:hypothetical protein
MASQHIEDTTMGRIAIAIMQIIGWFFMSAAIFPMIFFYASISSTCAFLVLTVGYLYVFVEGMCILIHDLIFGEPAHNNVNCPEFQEVLARYSRFWLDDTPPASPLATDSDSDGPAAQPMFTLPSTMAYLFGTQDLPNRRWSTAAAPETHAQTFRDYSGSNDELQSARRRIDRDTLALAMRSTTEERRRFADGRRRLTLPERRRRRLDRQREACDRSSLLYQLEHIGGW